MVADTLVFATATSDAELKLSEGWKLPLDVVITLPHKTLAIDHCACTYPTYAIFCSPPQKFRK